MGTHERSERSRSPGESILVRVCTISGESVLERQFDPVVSLEAVISALGEEEASWQLRLFQDSVELTEDLQLQDLCLKNDKNGGKASREAREARELTLSLVRSSPRTLALTGHCNGSLQLWDLDGRCIHTMGGAKDSKENEHQVTGLEVDWTGLRALSGDLCHNVRLWDLEKGKCLYIMAGHAATIGGVAVDWTRHLAVTHDAAGLLICWNLQTGSQLYLLFAHEGGVHDVEADWANLRFVSVGQDSIKTWIQGQELWTWHLRGLCRIEHLVDCGLECSWNDDRLAACWSMAVHLWDLQTGQLLWVLRGHSGDISGFEVNWEAQQICSWSEDGCILLWDSEHGQLLQKMIGHHKVTGAVCTWEPAFRCLSYGECTLQLWHPCATARAAVLNGHTNLISKAEVSWDRELALSWADDSTLKLWDLKERTCLRTLRGHVGPVWSAHVDWSKSKALSYSFAQRSLFYWNLQDGSNTEIFLEEEATRNLSAPSWIGGAEVDWESDYAVAWSLHDSLLRSVDLRRLGRPKFLQCCSMVSCARLQGSE